MRATGERARNPLAVQCLAWALTGTLDVDQSTGARDLASLGDAVARAGADTGLRLRRPPHRRDLRNAHRQRLRARALHPGRLTTAPFPQRG